MDTSDNTVQTTSANIDQKEINEAIKTADNTVQIVPANIDQQKINEVIKTAVKEELAKIDFQQKIDKAVKAKLAKVQTDIETLRKEFKDVTTYLKNYIINSIKGLGNKIATVEKSFNSEIATTKGSFKSKIDTVEESLLQALNSENGEIKDQLEGTLKSLVDLENKFNEFKGNASSVIDGYTKLERVATKSGKCSSVAESYETIIKCISKRKNFNTNLEQLNRSKKSENEGSNISDAQKLLAKLGRSKKSENEGSNTSTISTTDYFLTQAKHGSNSITSELEDEEDSFKNLSTIERLRLSFKDAGLDVYN